MAHLLLRSLLLLLAAATAAAAPRREAFRRDPGHPHWHHGAFHDVEDSVRADVRRMLHTRAEVPFQVPREVNVVLVGFNGDGGHRYSLDGHKLQEFLKTSFSHHRPSCLEAGQPELIALEKALRDTMVPAGTSRESEYGRAFPLFEVEATAVEQMFERLYSFIFDMEIGYSATKMDRNMPAAIFFVNFDKVRKDPRNMVNLDSLMYGDIAGLIEEDLQRQEGDYFYRYRYNGGGATQIWLSSGRYRLWHYENIPFALSSQT